MIYYRLYQIVGVIGWPLLWLWLRVRMKRGKEDEARLMERLGRASFARPDGRLIWIHAASVGESLSVQPLIEALLARYADVSILLTTVTVTSAGLMERRLPERAYHQYVPVDHLFAVRRFLRHWQPELALFVESELWPNMVMESHRQHIPLVLVNARMSARSERLWLRFLPLARQMLEAFRMILTQSEEVQARFASLGALQAEYTGNLKYDANPLPADGKETSHLLSAIGDRHVWLAASTHEGEEMIVANAHRHVMDHYDDLLTIIVPRHPRRGDDIREQLEREGVRVAQRSKGDAVTEDTGIYLADTMGELGIFYRLCDIVLIGGSLVDKGGQNPLEPARLDCAVLFGPNMSNFTAIAEEMESRQAARRVTEASLATDIEALFRHTEQQQALAIEARQLVQEKGGVIDRVLDKLADIMGEPTTHSLSEDESAEDAA